jgi:hydrogenase-4 membrane subunit HyfE
MDYYILNIFYILFTLSSLGILIESRIRYQLFFLLLQITFLFLPLFNKYKYEDTTFWILLVSILTLKGFMVVYGVRWLHRTRENMKYTVGNWGHPLLFVGLIFGIVLFYFCLDYLNQLVIFYTRVGIIYSALNIYLGCMGFFLRSDWISRIPSFIIFQNGILLFVFELADQLPTGLEIGGFLDGFLIVTTMLIYRNKILSISGEHK